MDVDTARILSIIGLLTVGSRGQAAYQRLSACLERLPSRSGLSQLGVNLGEGQYLSAHCLQESIMRWQDHIEQKADVLQGKPVIKGTRISVELILERLGDGWTDGHLLQSFPHLRAEHIRAAQAYAAVSLAADEFLFLNEPAA